MAWVKVDMRHEDPRRTKLANYDLAIAIARAFVKYERGAMRKNLKRARRNKRVLLRELRDEQMRAFPELRRRHCR